MPTYQLDLTSFDPDLPKSERPRMKWPWADMQPGDTCYIIGSPKARTLASARAAAYARPDDMFFRLRCRTHLIGETKLPVLVVSAVDTRTKEPTPGVARPRKLPTRPDPGTGTIEPVRVD